MALHVFHDGHSNVRQNDYTTVILKHCFHLWIVNSLGPCGTFRKPFEKYKAKDELFKGILFLSILSSFRITYRLILREKELHFHIGVFNPSKDVTFSFNLLLHTYLKVPDVRRCQITGLHGCTFIDKVSKIIVFSNVLCKECDEIEAKIVK